MRGYRETARPAPRAAVERQVGRLKALGLGDLATVALGQRYEATTALGETFAGEPWFRSTHQTGFTVDGYGDGLVVLIEQPPAAHRPHGGGSSVITAYGLDDASFARLRQRWDDWWRAHYGQASVTPG
jgi:hypothetical protein